jgi:hypothetical protein
VSQNKLSREEVMFAIDNECLSQDEKWGIDKQQSLPGFLLIMQKEINEAVEGWVKNREGKHAPLNEVVQVAAVAIRCLERYGVNGSATATNDI